MRVGFPGATPEDIWGYAIRKLTSGGVKDIWEYSKRGLTPKIELQFVVKYNTVIPAGGEVTIASKTGLTYIHALTWKDYAGTWPNREIAVRIYDGAGNLIVEINDHGDIKSLRALGDMVYAINFKYDEVNWNYGSAAYLGIWIDSPTIKLYNTSGTDTDATSDHYVHILWGVV